jgi:hypothetical protein
MYMTHSRQVVYFIRLHFLNYPYEVSGIGEIAIMQNEISVFHMWILVQVVYSVGIKHGAPALDPMNHISLLQQQFRKVSAVLSGNSGDESSFHLK